MTRHFALRYYGWMLFLARPLGLGPRRAGVDVSDEDLQVHMGWGFHARIPRRSIKQANRLRRRRDIWYAVGIHTLLRGRWIVNGSLQGVVTLELAPPVPARAYGVPIHLRWLAVSLEDPEGFLAALGVLPGV
jgi:hypothetical protein